MDGPATSVPNNAERCWSPLSQWTGFLLLIVMSCGAAGISSPALAQNKDAAENAAELARPVIHRDLTALPFPVRRMRELLVDAARSGDIEALRPYIGTGQDATLLSFGDEPEDPITFLKSLSGDDEGHEILAILQEILEAGFVHLETGTERELYVWPHFYALPIETLSPAQRVELYGIMTHGDYMAMVDFGAYSFFRVGITPEGRWQFFVAGD